MKKWIAAALALLLLALPVAPARAAFYELGDEIADFTLATIDGEEVSLSGLLAEKRMVLLNFWFIDCPWCDYEFPFLQEAWEERGNDVAVLALTPYDSAEAAREYRDANGFTFPMAVDTLGLSAAFGVTGFPTSVVIDRNGVCVFSEAGAQPSADAFRAIFAIYAAEEYEQSLVGFDVFAPRPSETMPPVEDMAAVLNERGTSVRYEELFSNEWPWLIRTDSGRVFAISSNTFVDETTSWLRGTVSAKAGDVLAFDYRVSSEYLDDYFVFSVNDKPTKVFSGECDWSTYAYRFPEDGEYRIAFAFEKGFSGRDGDDCASLDAVRLLSGAEADTAIAELPAWPAALEGAVCAIEAVGTQAREVVIDDPSGTLESEWGFDSYYILPDGDTGMRLLLGDGCDPDGALVYTASAQEIFHPSECATDASGFLFDAAFMDMDGQGHLYGATVAYPFHGDFQTGVTGVMFFDSEESLEQFLRLAIVDENHQPLPDVTWTYADALVSAEKDYGLFFRNENGDPVADVAVRVVLEAGVIELVSDEEGTVGFSAIPGAFHVEVVKVPSGLYFDEAMEIAFPEDGGTVAVTLTFAE